MISFYIYTDKTYKSAAMQPKLVDQLYVYTDKTYKSAAMQPKLVDQLCVYINQILDYSDVVYMVLPYNQMVY